MKKPTVANLTYVRFFEWAFAQALSSHEILKMPRAMLVVVFYCEIFLKEKTNMNNKLEASLSQNDLNSLFSTKVEKASNNYFYIMTKTHKIYIKNPQITWDQPYTEPDGAAIKYVDTTETVIAPTSTTRTELFFNGVASIENYPDLALFDSVILDSPIIEPFELLKNQQFSYNLDYHLWDFGTGEDIDLYNDTKSLSEEEQVLIDYIHKNGTQDPNDIMTTEIDIDNELGYYRFHLTYNETSFYHFAYSNTYEEDWESCITYHEKFEDEEQ